MINRTAITQWNKIVPWNDNAQVEQDLIISRALVAIFSDKFLASQLAIIRKSKCSRILKRKVHFTKRNV